MFSKVCDLAEGDERLVGKFSETPLFSDWTFHRLGLVIVGVFTSITIAIALFHICSHARHSSNIQQQKHVMRILLMAPIFSLSSLGQMLFYWKWYYFEMAQSFYEAVVVSSFVRLLIQYLFQAEDPDRIQSLGFGKTLVIRFSGLKDPNDPNIAEMKAMSNNANRALAEDRLVPSYANVGPPLWTWPVTWMEKWFGSLCCLCMNGCRWTGRKEKTALLKGGAPPTYALVAWQTPRTAAEQYEIIHAGIYQWVLLQLAGPLVAALTQHFMTELYCEASWAPYFIHVYTTAIPCVSMTVALYFTIQWAHYITELFPSYHPVAKFWTIKVVVFIFFTEVIVWDFCLSAFHWPKPSAKFQYPDLHVGGPAIMISFQCILVAATHFVAYSTEEYTQPRTVRQEDGNYVSMPPYYISMARALFITFVDIPDMLGIRDICRALRTFLRWTMGCVACRHPREPWVGTMKKQRKQPSWFVRAFTVFCPLKREESRREERDLRRRATRSGDGGREMGIMGSGVRQRQSGERRMSIE